MSQGIKFVEKILQATSPEERDALWDSIIDPETTCLGAAFWTSCQTPNPIGDNTILNKEEIQMTLTPRDDPQDNDIGLFLGW